MDSDFLAVTKELVFKAELESECVTFNITRDDVIEQDEKFGVSFTVLSDPSIATPGGVLISEVTILDGLSKQFLDIVQFMMYCLTL